MQWESLQGSPTTFRRAPVVYASC